MAWSTFFLIWCILGFLNGLYTVKKEWSDHKLFDSTPGYIAFYTVGMLVLCTVGGLIGVAVSIWERWFDPSNI